MDKKTEKELLEVIKKNYEEIGEEFDKTRQKHPWPELFNLFKGIKDGDRVLDVGCGNGRLLKIFKKKKIEYLGVDQNSGLIKRACQRYPDHRFVQGDILDLGKLAEHNFDYVVCLAVLHHLPGKSLRIKALGQLKNKVSPGGKIILSVWNLWSQKKFKKLIFIFFALKLIKKHRMDFGDILFDWKRGQRSKRYYHAFTKHELESIIKKADLKLEKLYKDKYNYYIVLKK